MPHKIQQHSTSNKLFFCQTTSAGAGKLLISSCTGALRACQSSNQLEAQYDVAGCTIKIEAGDRRRDSNLVYGNLAESAHNALFQPAFKITLSVADHTPFDGLDRELSSGLLKSCHIGQAIELLVFNDVHVVNWTVQAAGIVDSGIVDFDLHEVESELSRVGAIISGFVLQLLTENSSIGHSAKVSARPVQSLWTARTLLITRSDQALPRVQQWVENWIGECSPKQTVTEKDLTFTAGWGNNLLVFSESLGTFSEFAAISSSMQFVYAKLHLTNDTVSDFLNRFRSKKVDKKSQNELKNTEHDFFFIEYTLLEVEYSLQGLQRKILLSIMAAWRIEDLFKNINYKILRIKSLLTEALNEKYGFIQKNIRGLLMLIGLFEVLGAVVEIIHLSHSPEVETSHWSGMLNVIHSIEPDVLMTTLLIILGLLGFFAIAFGIKNQEEE